MSVLRFVVPRYGADVVGGAEWGARALATGLAREGERVEILTSCARSHVTWEDDYEPGTTTEDGVTVHRFPVRRPRDPEFDRLSDRILPMAAQVDDRTALDWIDRQGPDSPELLDAVAAVDDGHLAFYPYLYQPTVRGIPLARVPTIIHPAAHEEPPLHLPVIGRAVTGADALAYHTRAEQALVLERFPAVYLRPQAVIGLPVETPDPAFVDPDRARRDLDLGDEPFVVCLGRVDRGKGTHALIEHFAAYRERSGGGRLVLAGPVVESPPAVDGVTCLGPVPEESKYGLLAAADVLVNPSPHESFSIVMLEAWLVGTPVLVNGTSAPMRDHCADGGGGLWFTGRADFVLALERLLADASLRAELASAGHEYVRSNFSWSAVSTRYGSLRRRLD